jgi:hypothetical protein
MQRAAAIDHEIFRDNLEPIHDRLTREDVIVVRGTQTDPYSVVCESIEAIGRH